MACGFLHAFEPPAFRVEERWWCKNLALNFGSASAEAVLLYLRMTLRKEDEEEKKGNAAASSADSFPFKGRIKFSINFLTPKECSPVVLACGIPDWSDGNFWRTFFCLIFFTHGWIKIIVFLAWSKLLCYFRD